MTMSWKIDSSKCTGCGVCVNACPKQAITIYDDLAMINEDLCVQCSTCVELCPAGAIREVVPAYARLAKGGGVMRGRSWFGWGYRGWGRGNPYPPCRFYPWLPQRWWTYGPGSYPQMTPAYYPTHITYRWR